MPFSLSVKEECGSMPSCLSVEDRQRQREFMTYPLFAGVWTDEHMTVGLRARVPLRFLKLGNQWCKTLSLARRVQLYWQIVNFLESRRRDLLHGFVGSGID